MVFTRGTLPRVVWAHVHVRGAQGGRCVCDCVHPVRVTVDASCVVWEVRTMLCGEDGYTGNAVSMVAMMRQLARAPGTGGGVWAGGVAELVQQFISFN